MSKPSTAVAPPRCTCSSMCTATRATVARPWSTWLQTYEKAGLFLGPEELPDHLCVVLEFASTQPPALAKAFLGEMAHILNAIFSALLKRESPYAAVIAAVLELAGQKAQAVAIQADEAIDEAWAEPEAFDGCSTKGQASPGEAQPIHIVRKKPAGAPERATA